MRVVVPTVLRGVVIIVPLLVLVGCTSPTSDTSTPTMQPTPTSTIQATPTPTVQPTPTPEPTMAIQPTPDVTPSPDAAGSDPSAETSQALMIAALAVFFTRDSSAVLTMGESGDPSYIPALMEFLRFPWLLSETTKGDINRSLINLSRLSPDELAAEKLDWEWWVKWLGKHPEVQPPPGYAAWKGALFSGLVDPAMGAFFYEGVPARIRLEEIVWGGVPKDGIPDLINPPVLTADAATYLSTSDRVFGVSINGEHRAYPLRILNPHEMANDVVGGVPIALAY